jgi:RNA polymerase sigma-70 factor (ECF subfamily)
MGAALSAAPERSGWAVPEDSPCEAIYEQNFDFVWRNVRRLGVPAADADEAVQEVFRVVFRRLEEFHGFSAPRAWLFGIVARVASDHRRAGAPREAHGGAASLVETLLASIDDGRREVFVLVELEQMSVAEAAVALRLSVSTIHARLSAARRQWEAAVGRLGAAQKGNTRTPRPSARRSSRSS